MNYGGKIRSSTLGNQAVNIAPRNGSFLEPTSRARIVSLNGSSSPGSGHSSISPGRSLARPLQCRAGQPRNRPPTSDVRRRSDRGLTCTPICPAPPCSGRPACSTSTCEFPQQASSDHIHRRTDHTPVAFHHFGLYPQPLRHRLFLEAAAQLPQGKGVTQAE